MAIEKNKEKFAICAVDYAFRRIGGKYKGRILWHLHIHQVLRYGELRKTILDITPKMLSQTLKELELDGLIHRESYHEVPPRVEYTLTPVGIELIPAIGQLFKWGFKQLEKGKAANMP
ncbi:transcriptional regulator, HxlR family [Chitinophaga costaii]|uniref:Transcriptional regulator, HxlR family n=1 Tax=Chitinophaga costaii TaxID=1335309 RepID=A0A1C4ARW4_9BACT|nr:helix-turn-helix domain-containing protein [Chitinophaga costaii]PUZ26724.1 transcriptional regulator [Chitinophaga costaii]SCB97430.1 transcriptional regulator, HxlR family [Chitinophaga costaii]